MAVIPLDRYNKNLVPYDEYTSKKRDKLLRPAEDEDDSDLSEEQVAELGIARYCLQLFRDAERARAPYETFEDCWDIFNGNVWPAKYPVWKARITLNKIRAFIWFMQAVMTDQKPRVNVEPLNEASAAAAKLLGKLVDRDWDENDVQRHIALAVLYGLIFGTGYLKVTYNPAAAGGKGKHEWAAPVPYKIYLSPTATGCEDTDYVVHVEDQSMAWIARNFPKKYNVVRRFKGARVDSSTDVQRDLVREGFGQNRLPIENAVRTSINNVVQDLGRPSKNMDDNETIEVAEFWFHDPEYEEYERQKIVDGVPQMKDAFDADGMPLLEVTGYEQGISELDGMPFVYPVFKRKRVPDMETACRPLYPNGRLVIMAGPVVLRDIPNPYQIDGFPFASWKNQDVGAPLGTGEPLNLKDANIGMNRMMSQAYDIIEKMGNPMFKYKKGSGLETRTLKNKPGSIIPLDEMDALQPLETKADPKPAIEVAETLKGFMGEVAGLQDAVMGASPGGNTAFATVDSLQESGAAPIRQRVRNMESMLKRAGTLRIQLIQQFDDGSRPIRERIDTQVPSPQFDEDGEPIESPMPAEAAEIRFTEYKPADLQGPVEFGVVPDSSLSVSPAGLKNFYLMLYDKKVVDQQAVLDKLKIDDGPAILKRMQQQQLLAAMMKQRAKPGPAPKGGSRTAERRPGPPSQVPSRLDNSSIR